MGINQPPRPDALPLDDPAWDLPWDPPTPPAPAAQTLTTESTVGRPLTRWRQGAAPRCARLLELYHQLQVELAGLVINWPRPADVTYDVAIAFDEREVAWTVICAQREAAQAAWTSMAGLKWHLEAVQTAVRQVPSSWTAEDTALFNERPDLFGCDPDAPERARQRSAFGPWSLAPSAPETR